LRIENWDVEGRIKEEEEGRRKKKEGKNTYSYIRDFRVVNQAN